LTSFLFLFASWMMPLHLLPWISWHNEVLAFASGWVLLWQCLPSRRRGTPRASIEIPWTASFFIALALAVLIQGAAGLITFWGDVLVLELYLALCVMVVSAGFVWARTDALLPDGSRRSGSSDLLQAMAWTLLAGALASSLIALAQVFEVWNNNNWIAPLEYARRPGANIAQPNQLATLLLMGIASLVYLRECRKLSIGTAALGFVVLATGLAATESRTGLLSFVLLSAWWFAGRGRAGLKLSIWAAVGGMAGFLALYFSWPSLMSSSGAFAPGAQIDAQAGMRIVVWPQLLEAVALRPWWGWGLREVSEAHNAVASSYSLSEPYTYSHNIVLDLALGLGLPAATLFVVAASVWLFRRLRSARSLTTWYCLAGALPVAVHSMLEFPFAYAYFLVPTMFLVGVLEASTAARPPVRVPAFLLTTGLLLLLVVGGWSALEYMRIEEDFRIVRFEALRIGQTPPEYERPKVHLLTQLDALLRGARIVPHPGMSPDEVDLARKVALRYPWPATQNRYALSLALNGNPGEAIRQMRVMLALHGKPTYSQIKANWSALAADKYPALNLLVLP
jgi:O-antigen ligase